MFGLPMVTFLDHKKEYGEDRWVGIGWLSDMLAVVVFTASDGDTVRIIPPARRTDMNRTSTQKKSGTDWAKLRRMKDEDIDFSDIPPVDRSMFKKMVIRMPEKKAALSIRLDPGVVAWFRKQGRGYQTRINAVLRSYVEVHSR